MARAAYKCRPFDYQAFFVDKETNSFYSTVGLDEEAVLFDFLEHLRA
jgi:hypothetical protein